MGRGWGGEGVVGAHLDVVGQEDGAGEAASDAAADIDDGDAEPSGQLLHVTHDEALEDHCDDQLQEAANTSHARTLQLEKTR